MVRLFCLYIIYVIIEVNPFWYTIVLEVDRTSYT